RFRLAGDDALLAWCKRDASGGPHRVRATDLRKAPIDCAQVIHQLAPGVAPARHGGGSRVVLLADDREFVLPDRDDGGDDADPQSCALQKIALLDMRLQKAGVARGIDLMARAGGPARGL